MNEQMQVAARIDTARGESYGDFREMAALAQSLKGNLLRVKMTDVQKESMELICTKLARIACGNPNHIDSWVDIAGYANLVVRDLNSVNLGADLKFATTMEFVDRPAASTACSGE